VSGNSLPSAPSHTEAGAGALELCCHPERSCPAVRRLEAQASLDQGGLLSLRFTVLGNLEALSLPSLEPPARRDHLWEHTCCEAFLAVPGAAGYLELNLAPAGAWAVYAFQRYREPSPLPEGLVPRITTHKCPGHWTLDAQLRLPQALWGRPLRLALATVVEQQNGELSYWALRHPAEHPDFHHPQSFVLALTPDGRHEDRP